jgi:hypothetical protein
MPIDTQSHRFSYNFHAVGQGMFASGSIRRMGDDAPHFNWVYDCGTSSSPKLIDDAIARQERLMNQRKRLDLVTLSHFDHDHISGICRLAGKFEIDTLMLPYMTQEQRLWMALEEDMLPDDNLMGFFVNPTAFLSAIEGPGIRNILYVPPGGDKGPPAQPVDPPKEFGPDKEDGAQMEMDYEKEPGGEDPALVATAPIEVRLLRQGGTIRLQRYWEFVPYNDDVATPATSIPEFFREQVRLQRHKLIQGMSGDPERKQALEALIGIYKMLGTGSEKRNIISLFLHAGPVYSTWENVSIFDCCQNGIPYRHGHWHFLLAGAVPPSESQSSLLYTGDGYLDNQDRLNRLIGFLGKDRVERVGIIQVMHHGAETNWHEGVAEKFKPLFSVFSSDPNRKKWWHPHAAVLRDFWNYGPLQVDKYRNVSIKGLLEMR